MINYSNGTITSREVTNFLSLTGRLRKTCDEIIKNREASRKAKELGIVVSDEDLQRYADTFRILSGLHTVEETNRFLESAGMNEDDLEQYFESDILKSALKEHLGNHGKVEEYFLNNRPAFDRARISVIVVKEPGLANEIICQVTEDGEDFHRLARKFSLDESTRFSGGYAGEVSRGMFTPEVSAKVFNAAPGELLGPFHLEGLFHLILVEEVRKADLDDAVRSAIKEAIFEDWSSQFLKAGIAVERQGDPG